MSDKRDSLAGLVEATGNKLDIVAVHLWNDVATADEVMECSRLAFALADAMKLYAEKMPKAEPDGRHSLRQQSPET